MTRQGLDIAVVKIQRAARQNIFLINICTVLLVIGFAVLIFAK